MSPSTSEGPEAQGRGSTAEHVERLGLEGLEDHLPADYFGELLERLDRRVLAYDVLGIVAFALVEATIHFTGLIVAVGLTAHVEESTDA